MKDNDDLLQAISDLGQEQEDLEKQYEAHVDKWWNGLSEEEREQAFYAVCKRIHTAEIDNDSTYRGVLYNAFGFSPSMYCLGMECGFFDIHNILFLGREMEDLQSAKSVTLIDESGMVPNVEVQGLSCPEYHYSKDTQNLTVKYNFSGKGTITTVNEQ